MRERVNNYKYTFLDSRLDDELLETEAGNLSAVTRIQHVADHILISESGKLVFLIKLLDQLKVEGHRCLVFSQSRKMLDIMQKILTNKVYIVNVFRVHPGQKASCANTFAE